MDDGKVIIQVITNADQAEKLFKGLDKSIDNTKKSTSEFDKTANLLKKTLQKLGIALTIRQTIKFGQELIQTTQDLQALDNQLIASTKSAELAGEAYQFVSEEVERLGLDLKTTLDGFSKFSASALRSNLTFGQTKQIFTDVSSALISLNADSQTTLRVFRALEQISSKGVVALEEIKLQLGDALPGALSIASKALGVTQAEFLKLVSQGRIASDEFLPAFAREIRNSLGTTVEDASQQARANFNRLNNSILLLKDSLGRELLPEFNNLAISIREFIDNEGEDIIKIFAILVDTVKLLSKTLAITSKLARLKIETLPQDFLDLKRIVEEFGNTVGDTERRLRDLDKIGESLNENLTLTEEVKTSYSEFLAEVIDIESVAQTIGNSLADALTTPFEEGETAGERFKKVMLGILRDISRQLIATGIARAITGLFGGGATPAPAIAPSAKGNIIANNNIKPFARGGVVNKPTLFPMQSGMGLMGEAGPEAILPLKRTPDGKLGVEATGQGGGTINIFNQTPAKIEVINRPNKQRDIFIREFNSALISDRSKNALETALQNQSLEGVQAV